MSPWRLLITRSAPDGQQLVSQLNAQGIHCTYLPLIETTPLPETPTQRQQLLNVNHYTSIIVTSKIAARLLLEKINIHAHPPINQQWFTIGKATAHLLQQAGIHAHYPCSEENSEALWELLEFQHAISYPNAKLLIAKGHDGRQWLLDQLQLKTITTDTLDLYQRHCPAYAPSLIDNTVSTQQLNGIVISSGQGLTHLHTLTKQTWSTLKQLPLFVPSQRVAKQAETLGATHIINCDGAHQKALLHALNTHNIL